MRVRARQMLAVIDSARLHHMRELGIAGRCRLVVFQGMFVERGARRFAVCCASRKAIGLSSGGVVPADVPDAVRNAPLEEESARTVALIPHVPSRKKSSKSSSEIRGALPKRVTLSLPEAMNRFTVRMLTRRRAATSSGRYSVGNLSYPLAPRAIPRELSGGMTRDSDCCALWAPPPPVAVCRSERQLKLLIRGHT